MKTHTKRERAAIYVRVSSEEQEKGYSLDAQERQCRLFAESRGLQVARVYSEGKSAFRGTRPTMNKLLQAASEGAFDAVIVHKWDRFGRNRHQTIMFKAMLREQHGIAVFSATEPSEDDNDTGLLYEGLMEVINHQYILNLRREVKKAYSEKHEQGYHLRNAMFGYDKVGRDLIINPHEAMGVILAFTAYDTGHVSYTSVAHMLNERGYRTKTGRLFSYDTTREILRNPVYAGKVRYQPTDYNPDGSRSFRNPVQVNDGHHEPIISQELFDRVQVKIARRRRHKGRTTNRPYMLQGLLYCARCIANPPDNPLPSWGKMHSRQHNRGARYGFCPAHKRGSITSCAQKSVELGILEEQAVQMLSRLAVGEDWRERAILAIADAVGESDAAAHLAELQTIAANMDVRFDHGLVINMDEYLHERMLIQEKINQLQPLMTVPEELEYAADLLNNFSSHFAACGDDIAAQNELIRFLVKGFYVEDDKIVAVELTADINFVLKGAGMFVEDQNAKYGHEGIYYLIYGIYIIKKPTSRLSYSA